MEVRYVAHTPNLLINYVTKAEAKPNIKKVIEDIRKSGGTITGASVAARAQDYRRVSLPEAFFRIDSRLFFSNTNLQVVFVNTNFPDKRGTMYKLSPDGLIKLPGREGSFELVKGSLASYAKRLVKCSILNDIPYFYRPMEPFGIKLLSGQQYSMCYRVPKGSEVHSAMHRLGLFSDKMYAIVGGQEAQIPESERMLPLSFQATDGTFRFLRQTPVVVDTTKFPESDTHNSQYADLLMFRPWFDENDELGSACRNKHVCSVMHSHYAEEMNAVKEGCRNFLLRNL